MHYNTKIDIIRPTLVEDGLGGHSETETTLHKNLPCRINWSKGAEAVLFNKITSTRDAKIYCRVVDIVVTDHVELNGKQYNIVSVRDVDNANRQLVLEVKSVE